MAMTDYDSPWKEALDAYFQPFLELCFPALAAKIDWSTAPKMLDKELMQIAPQSELGLRTVDKLVEVKLLSDTVAWLLVHLEVQSQRDADFTQRMFVYFYRVRDKYNKRVVSLAVLGDGEAAWCPDRYQESNFGCELDFKFPIVKLLDFVDEIERLQAAANPFAFVILAHLMTMKTAGDPVDRCQWKLRLLRPLYERGFSAEDVRKLFRVLDWMMRLPEDLEIEFRDRLERYEQENSMPYITSIERMAKQEGREEGLLAGKIQMLQRVLAIGVESEESLLQQTVEQLTKKLHDLQQRFEAQR
jgi:hypothetical protein